MYKLLWKRDLGRMVQTVRLSSFSLVLCLLKPHLTTMYLLYDFFLFIKEHPFTKLQVLSHSARLQKCYRQHLEKEEGRIHINHLNIMGLQQAVETNSLVVFTHGKNGCLDFTLNHHHHLIKHKLQKNSVVMATNWTSVNNTGDSINFLEKRFKNVSSTWTSWTCFKDTFHFYCVE